MRSRHLISRFPARFAVRKDRNQPAPRREPCRARRRRRRRDRPRGLREGFHAPGPRSSPFRTCAAAEAALKAGEIDYVFADGLGLALWLGGEDAADCCDFSGGPYLESRFFGEGIGFIIRKDDETLRRAFDFALQQLWKEGKYAELYLRFFPVSPF